METERFRSLRKTFELRVVFGEPAVNDLKVIYKNIRDYSGSENEAKYVLNLIYRATEDLGNPFISGSIPYSARIANLGYKQIPIVGGNYLVFFRTEESKKLRIIDYIKSARTNYQDLIC